MRSNHLATSNIRKRVRERERKRIKRFQVFCERFLPVISINGNPIVEIRLITKKFRNQDLLSNNIVRQIEKFTNYR